MPAASPPVTPHRREVYQTISPTVAAAHSTGPSRWALSPTSPSRHAIAWVAENVGWLLKTTCVVSARRTEPPLTKK